MSEHKARINSGENSTIRERRRQQLIGATLASIAKRGFAETTLGDVAAGAKLSHGIVNFHFRSKDELLVETLRQLAEEYRATWHRAVERAGPGAADKLAALLLAPLDPLVCSRKKIAVWHAFYGEAKSRPTYFEICGARDQENWQATVNLVEQVIAEGGYDGLDPLVVARGLDAMGDGLWLDLLFSRGALDRAPARATVLAFLALVFPKHFPQTERPQSKRKVA